MISQRCMKLRFTSMAEGGTRSSQAISPALLCERLRGYLLGSVWPILAATGVSAHTENALVRAKAQSIGSGYTRRIILFSSHGCQAGHILKPPKNIYRGKDRQAEIRNRGPIYSHLVSKSSYLGGVGLARESAPVCKFGAKEARGNRKRN